MNTNNKHALITLMLILFALLQIQSKPIRANPEMIIVPDNYRTIQQAINAANEGDVVFVRGGIYFEHIAVNKSIWLIGESQNKTIIDGGGAGTIAAIKKSDVHLKGFTIRNAGYTSDWRNYSGIYFDSVANGTIDDVSVISSSAGISLFNASYISIRNNSISRNHFGIAILDSFKTIMRDNSLTFNNIEISGYRGANLKVFGNRVLSFIQDIDSSNRADGKPICYWVDQNNKEVPPDVGYVSIVRSTNITARSLTVQGLLLVYTNNSLIEGFNVSNASIGVEMLFSNNNRIVNSVILSNDFGLGLVDSHLNLVVNNNISKSSRYGIGLGGPNGSSNNLIADNRISYSSSHAIDIYGNNNTITQNELSHNSNGILLDKASQNTVIGNRISNNSASGIYLIRGSDSNVISKNTITFNTYGILIDEASKSNIIYHNNFLWNKIQTYTSMINVWNDHLEGNYWNDYRGADSNQDGIGDAPYIIKESNEDNHPLMGMFYSFNATSEYSILIISNSSVFGFYFNQSSKIVRFNVYGSIGTISFCRVRIPKTLLGDGPYVVTIDGSPPLVLRQLSISNSTYEFLYFMCQVMTTHEVLILPGESSSPAILLFLLFLVICLSAIVLLKRRKRRFDLNF